MENTYLHGIINGLVNLTLFGLVVLIRRLVHKEGIKSFWLVFDKKGGLEIIEGAFVGIVSFALYPLLTMATQQGTIRLEPEKILDTISLVLAWGFGFAGVALFEEALFRGYILRKLLNRLSPVISIGIVALLFGALHIFSYSPSYAFWIGIINAIFVAVISSVTVVKSRSLMWALGFHWTWDLTQQILLIDQNSSEKTTLNMQIQKGILAGSSSVPESGLIVTFILAALGFYIFVKHRKMMLT